MNKASPKITRHSAPEPEVLARARRGDSEAFAALYNEHHAAVFRYVRSRVGMVATAEDLTSETFLRALRRIETFEWTGQSIGAWLVTIARNLVTDHYKAARTRYEISFGDIFDVDEASGMGAEDTAVAEMLRAGTRQVIDAALSHITPRQAEVIRRRFFDDLSVSETASAMGTSAGAAKTTMFRAMVSLRPQLECLRGAA